MSRALRLQRNNNLLNEILEVAESAPEQVVETITNEPEVSPEQPEELVEEQPLINE